MGYSISVKIDAVYQSKPFKGFFTLIGEDIDEIKEVAKKLVSEILSFPERKVDKKDLSRIIPSTVDLEKIDSGVGKTIDWLDLGYKSDVGRVRELDEDSLVIITTETSYGEVCVLLVLGDGVGGHNKGEVASYLGTKIVAVDLTPLMLSIPNNTEIKNSIVYSIKKANDGILNYVMSHPECEGMATTMTVALLREQDLYVGNVGDSRAYILNEDEIRQVTKDHSLVQEMVDAGKITKEEARHHPKKNVVTRVVGYYRDIEVDTFEEKIWGDDDVMLCCDGLSDVLRDDEIKDVIVKNEDRQRACDKLVKITNERGGPDNISVITAHSNKIPRKKRKREREIGISGKKPSTTIGKKKILVPIAFAIILLCFMGYVYYGYYSPKKGNNDLIGNKAVIADFYACMNSNDYTHLQEFCVNGSNAWVKIGNFIAKLNEIDDSGAIMLSGEFEFYKTTKDKGGYRIIVNDTTTLFVNRTKIDLTPIVEYQTKGENSRSFIDKILLEPAEWKIKDIKWYTEQGGGDLPTPILPLPPKLEMHVNEIEMAIKPINFKSTLAIANVTVSDSLDDPVYEATVDGYWDICDTNRTDCSNRTVNPEITGRDGRATFKTPTEKEGSYTFTVGRVTKSGWIYNSSANIETEDCITYYSDRPKPPVIGKPGKPTPHPITMPTNNSSMPILPRSRNKEGDDKMSVLSKIHNIQLVQIQPEERLAATSELNLASSLVTGCLINCQSR